MMRTATTILAVLVVLVMPTAAFAGLITFNVVYQDVVGNSGVGFDHATYGAARRATFESVFSYLNTVLDENGRADIYVNTSQTDGAGSLASAGTYHWTSPDRFSGGFAFEHITTGVDPSAGNVDINATFDFGYSWNSELDNPTASEFDLYTVALHEITHGLGFASLLSGSGTSKIGGQSDPGVFTIYDSFLELGNGNDLFAAGGDYIGTVPNITGGDIYFNGANATAANGGSRVKIYAPSTYSSGSSISHVDTSGIGSLPNAIMQYSIGTGTMRRTYDAAEIGILQDLGYSIAPIPEPTSLALAGFGIVLLAVAARRRSRRRSS